LTYDEQPHALVCCLMVSTPVIHMDYGVDMDYYSLTDPEGIEG